VRLETWFAEDGRLTTRRDWHITDARTGAYLGAATRCVTRIYGGSDPWALGVAVLLCHPLPSPKGPPPPPQPPHPTRPPTPARNSTWVTINSETRKLAKLPEEIRTRWLLLAPSPARTVLPASDTKRKLQEFPPTDRAAAGPVVSARRSDMDPNGHINNVCYLSWALEAVPEYVYNNYNLREVRRGF